MKKRVILMVIAILTSTFLLSGCGVFSYPSVTEDAAKIDCVVDGEIYDIIKIDPPATELPDDPKKDGYEFDGWYWDDGVWEEPFAEGPLPKAPYTKDDRIYAKFVPAGTDAFSSSFYSIQKAYDSKFLSYDDLVNIALHNNKSYYRGVSFYQRPESLSVETENKIKQAFLDEYLASLGQYDEGWYKGPSQEWMIADPLNQIDPANQNGWHDYFYGYENGLFYHTFNRELNDRYRYTVDDVCISDYCGTYNGAVVAMIDFRDHHSGDAETSETVAGVEFYYNTADSLKVWIGDATPIDDPVDPIDHPATEGLSYCLINGGKEYSVSKGYAAAADVVIPNIYNGLPVTEISSDGFKDYRTLKSVKFPDSLRKIGGFAFLSCYNLQSVDIPDSVEIIEYYAFQNCSAIKTVTIGKGVKNINSNLFYACSYIESITVDPGNTAYMSQGNCLIRTADMVLITGCYNSVIPNGVTMLDTFAFSHVYDLKAVIIPITVKKMGSNVFNVCDKLTIYAEAAAEPEGWGHSWNPRNRPVCWNYKGGSFEDIVIPKPVIDTDYDHIAFDIKNLDCASILTKLYGEYTTGRIGVKTLTYGTIIAFGNLVNGPGGSDFFVKCGRSRAGFGTGFKEDRSIGRVTLETIMRYWTLIKPVISNELRSENFSYTIYQESYSVRVPAIDVCIDRLISGMQQNGEFGVSDACDYTDSIYAASYGKGDDNRGPKLASELMA